MNYFRDIVKKADELEPSLALLSELYERYVHTAMYNNLEVVLGRMHTLKPEDAFHHVVELEEGGTCRNNNLAFFYLLKKIGFHAHLTSGDVHHFNEHKMSYTQSCHMLIIVTVNQDTYVCDPSWGNAPRAPLPLSAEPVMHAMCTYRVNKIDGHLFGVEKLFADYILQYTFDPKVSKHYSEFQGQLEYVYDDQSFFRQNLFLTKAMSDRCYSITNDSMLIEYADRETEKCYVTAKGGLRRVLLEVFGFSERYIDGVDWESETILPQTKSTLSKVWKVNPSQLHFGQTRDPEEPHQEVKKHIK